MPPSMRLIFNRAALAVIIYACCWVVAYFAIFASNGDFDPRYLVSYFVMAWTFSAGEIPSFIWLVSLALFSIVILFWLLVAWRRRLTKTIGA
jgi:hypothetical protein